MNLQVTMVNTIKSTVLASVDNGVQPLALAFKIQFEDRTIEVWCQPHGQKNGQAMLFTYPFEDSFGKTRHDATTVYTVRNIASVLTEEFGAGFDDARRSAKHIWSECVRIGVVEGSAEMETLPKGDGASVVDVAHFAKHGSDDEPRNYGLEVLDHRREAGQLAVSLQAKDGHTDEGVYAFMEVNDFPEMKVDEAPCLHLHFDEGNLAMSIYRVGDDYFIRLEHGVKMIKHDSGFGVYQIT